MLPYVHRNSRLIWDGEAMSSTSTFTQPLSSVARTVLVTIQVGRDWCERIPGFSERINVGDDENIAVHPMCGNKGGALVGTARVARDLKICVYNYDQCHNTQTHSQGDTSDRQT